MHSSKAIISSQGPEKVDMADIWSHHPTFLDPTRTERGRLFFIDIIITYGSSRVGLLL